MKKTIQKITTWSSLLLFAVALLPPAKAFAATSISVGSASVTQGSNVTVPVSLSTGGSNVDLVEATLSYPSDRLTCLSINSSGEFPIAPGGDTCSGGTASFTRGRTANYSANGTVVTITFRANIAGSAPVSVASATTYDGGNPSTAGGSTGTITVNAPAPPPSGGGGSPAPVTTTKPVPKPATTPTTTSPVQTAPTQNPATPAGTPPDASPPAISNLKITDITEKSAVVTWSTNEPATSIVEYGLGGNFGFQAVDPSLMTDHRIVLDSNLIERGLTYNLRVKSADASGNVAASEETTFQALADSKVSGQGSRKAVFIVIGLLFCLSLIALLVFLARRQPRLLMGFSAFGRNIMSKSRHNKILDPKIYPNQTGDIKTMDTPTNQNPGLTTNQPGSRFVPDSMTLEQIEKKFTNKNK